ncbi:hypothetical protein BC830DRAFT_1159944, partial [Chytriomyces sp. MP71]
ILNRIIPFLDASTIVPFCHSLRSLHFLSRALYEVGSAFNKHISDLWPVLYFPRPVQDDSTSDPAPAQEQHIPVKHLHKLFHLSQLLDKYAGSAALVACSPGHLESLVTLLPRRVQIHSPTHVAGYTYAGRFDAFLRVLAGVRELQVDLFEFPATFEGSSMGGVIVGEVARWLARLCVKEISFCGDLVPAAVLDALASVKELEVLRMEDAGKLPVRMLPRCESLRRLVLEFPSCRLGQIQALLKVLPKTRLEEVEWLYYDACRDELLSLNWELSKIGWVADGDEQRMAWCKITNRSQS